MYDRLRNKSKLTPEEVRDLIPWMQQVSTGGVRRLDAELALQSIEAIQKFAKSSSKVNCVLIGLTTVIGILTAVLVYYTYLLAQVPR